MFVPAQYAVAKAVADCVAEGTIPATAADELVIVCGVFLHPSPGRGQRQDRQVQPRGHQARHPAGHEELAGHCRDHRTEGQGRAPLCQVSVANSRVGTRHRDRETSAPRHRPNRTRAAMVPSDAERAYHEHVAQQTDHPGSACHRFAAQRVRCRGRRGRARPAHRSPRRGYPGERSRPRLWNHFHPRSGRPESYGHLHRWIERAGRRSDSGCDQENLLRSLPGLGPVRWQWIEHDRRGGRTDGPASQWWVAAGNARAGPGGHLWPSASAPDHGIACRQSRAWPAGCTRPRAPRSSHST